MKAKLEKNFLILGNSGLLHSTLGNLRNLHLVHDGQDKASKPYCR